MPRFYACATSISFQIRLSKNVELILWYKPLFWLFGKRKGTVVDRCHLGPLELRKWIDPL